MKTKMLLACAAVLALAWTAPAHAEDDRQAIHVSAEQRDFILAEMRNFLVAVQDIVLGMAEGDMASVIEVARSMGPGQGMGQGMGRAMGLNRVLPMEFRQMARGTHMAFGELALAAEIGPEGVLEDLGALMSNCTGCHATFKFEVNK